MARVCMRKEGNAREKGSGGGLEHRHVLQQEREGVCMQKGAPFLSCNPIEVNGVMECGQT